jgi:transposase
LVGDLDDIERDALAFLNRKQRERALRDESLKSTVNREAILGAVAALRDGCSWNAENKIEDLWAAEDSVITSVRFKQSSPEERLTSAYWSEYKRRITALLIQHERKQTRKSTSNAATEQIHRLKKLSVKPLANTKGVLLTASAWLRFVEVWGLGGLVMPGPGHQRA